MAAVAQHPVSKALIREKVNDNQLTMLRGNTPPAAIAQNDAGRVNGNMRMTDLILVLRRSPEMQAAFDAFVESQYDPNSPEFHQWLTPEQVGEKFGPAMEDISTVSAWLSGHGLSVEDVSKDRMTIRFSGSARQVETAFHTELHNLTVRGEAHFSNMSDPQIPMALEPVVLGPKALHNFRPRPLHRKNSMPALNAGVVGKAPSSPTANAAEIGARPNIGFSCGSGCQLEDVTPFDFAAIYNVAPVWSSGVNGTGQTIAIVATSDVKQSDVSSFKSTFGLSAGLNLITKLAHGSDPGNCKSTASPSSTNNWCTLDDQIENALDVEWAGAMAPGAQITLVVSGATSASDDTVFDSAQYAVQNNTAKILNVSYGLCELFLGTSGNTSYNNLWQSAASAGISVFVASGDAGAPACDQGGDASGTPFAAQYGLTVSGIASTPYNTAVGGTDLNWGNSASPYWNASNSSTTGASAKGYMPELPWNNSCTNPLALSYLQSWATQLQKAGFSATSPTDAESACNFVVKWYQTIASNTNPSVNLSSFVDTVGAGGGASNCTTNSSTSTTIGTCSASGYSKPSWQASVTGIPNDGKRDIPDVSFFSGNGFLGSAYFICVTDWGPCLTSATATTEPTDTSGNTVNLIGGTSAASPAMAGIMALINQKAGATQGNPNKQLYTLAGAQTYSSCKSESVTNSSSCYFNDIDSGTIDMPCASGSPNCTVSHSGDNVGVLSGFDAGVGFDNATGLGSLNVTNVVNGWASSTTPTATFKLSAAAPASIAAGGTATSNITVSSTDGYAATVTLSCALTSAPAGALEAPTCAPTTGQSTVTLSATTTSGTGQVTIGSTAAPAGAVKLASNRTGWFTAAGGAGFASLALFLLPGWSKRYRNIFCTMLVVLAASFFAVGCGGGGGGSSSGGGGGGVTKTTPTVTVTPAATTIKESDTLTVAIAVAGTSGTPTGTVTMSSGTTYNSGAIALDSTGKASITIPSGKLAPGTDTLGVTYSGDTKFNTAAGNASITVSKVATTSGTYTFTVTGTGNDSAHYTATTTFTVTVQ